MKKNLLTLSIVFSVVLNVVFLGSYFYRQSKRLPPPAQQTNHNQLLYKELNLSRTQLDRFEPARDKFHAFISKQGRKIKAKQLELIDLLARERPDRETIAAKQKEIQTLQQRMQAKVINHLLEESEIFTPEQRQKFFALIKEPIEKINGPHPPWMPEPSERTSP